MDVQEFIDKIEDDYLEADLESLTAKDRISVYLNAKEFMQAKLQRATAAPYTHDDTEITITVINSKEDI